MLAADSFFAFANMAEGLLWAAIGGVFSQKALYSAGALRGRCTIAGVTFLLFGVSDCVEILTGAWWRPWWLLAWKSACVVVLLGLLLDHYRRQRTKPNGADTGTAPPGA